jgi:cell division transport system permease protein
MRPQTIFYFITETLANLKRGYWMALASILTISLTMLILGFFAAILTNLDHIASDVESQLEITCFLDDAITSDMIIPLRNRILGIPGVHQVEFVSREEAMSYLNEYFGEHADLLSIYYGHNNPLPDAFRIRARQPEQVFEIVETLRGFHEITDLRYGHNYVRQLLNITSFVRIFGALIMIALGTAALFIVVNTVRSTLALRKSEIEIMRYVGATSFFIRVPFLLEGIFLGVIGSYVAFALTEWMYSNAEIYFRSEMLFISLAPAEPFLSILRFWILLAGAIFGAIGSSISLGRYLKV